MAIPKVNQHSFAYASSSASNSSSSSNSSTTSSTTHTKNAFISVPPHPSLITAPKHPLHPFQNKTSKLSNLFSTQLKTLSNTQKTLPSSTKFPTISHVYRTKLKNRNFDLERMTIAGAQGMSEGQNYEMESTQSKSDSSSCFGIIPPSKKDSTTFSPLSNDELGKNSIPLLKGYRLFDLIHEKAQGASAGVYNAMRLSDQAFFAAKKFSPSNTFAIDEYEIYKQLKDVSHVIQTYAFGRIDASPVIIMDKCSIDLFEYLSKKERLPLAQVRLIAVQAFEFLHQSKIIHGDLKLENMSVDESNILTIYDCGLSYDLRNKNTRPDLIASTGHQHPNVILGYRQYDQEVDMWSLAVSLFQLHTGRELFEATDDHCYLQSVAAVIGPFPFTYLKKLKLSHEYVTFDEQNHPHFKQPLKVICYDWKKWIKKTGQKYSENSNEIDQFIDLLDQMLQYEKTIQTKDALNHAFFSGVTNFSVQLAYDIFRTTELHIYKKNSYICKALIDLATPSNSLRCLHIPSSTHKCTVMLFRKGGQKPIFQRNMHIEQNTILHVTWDEKRRPIVKKIENLQKNDTQTTEKTLIPQSLRDVL